MNIPRIIYACMGACTYKAPTCTINTLLLVIKLIIKKLSINISENIFELFKIISLDDSGIFLRCNRVEFTNLYQEGF